MSGGALAAQAGYFELALARKAGYSAPPLESYIREGRVERVARGSFRLAHYPPTDHEDLVVVWLWSDRLGTFSHETALALHELSDALPAKQHVTVTSAWAKRRLRIPDNVILHFADLANIDKERPAGSGITEPSAGSTKCAAVFDMRRVLHEGQSPRSLRARGSSPCAVG